MRWDARGSMALLVSALVGITAGVIVGFTTGSPDDAGAAGGPGAANPSSSVTPRADDPFGFGAPLKNLPCNPDQTILVVGTGDTTGAMTNPISANKTAGVKYLQVAQSCDTLYGGEKQDPPEFAAYLGPFDDREEPCTLRMNVDHRNDVVTSLKEGVKIHVQCLCVLDPAEFPELAVGMRADTRAGIYIRALQRLLIDIGRNPTHHVTGIYDAQTAAMIKPLQVLNALDKDVYKTVERQTWGVLRDRACVDLDF